MAGPPEIDSMLEYYVRNFKVDHKPCKQVTYNCAVRLSLALNAGGMAIGDGNNPGRVHNSSTNHSHRWDKAQTDVSTVPHFVGADDLYGYLKRELPSFHRLIPVKGRNVRQQIQGQKGVVYFKNCFTRGSQKQKRGDHIDVWNGSQYGNELLGIDAAGRSSTSEDLFSRAQEVWFLRL